MELNPFSYEFHEDPYPIPLAPRPRPALPQRAARVLGLVALPRRAPGAHRLGDLQLPHYRVDEARCRRVHMSNVHGFARVPMQF